MFGKSKYDLMNSHMKDAFANLFNFYKYLDEAKMYGSLDYTGVFTSHAASCLYSGLNMLSHLGYENYLDIEGIKDGTIKRNFLFNVVGYDEFQKKYEAVTSRYLKVMIISMILESEGLFNFDTIEMYGKSILKNNEKEFFEILSRRYLSENNKSLLNVIKLDDFDISKLSQEQRERINEYHSDYMRKFVFTDSFVKDPDKKVIQHAKVHAGATLAQVLIKKFN